MLLSLKPQRDTIPIDLQGTTGDALAINFALSQLENCRLNHELCRQALPKRRDLPARLLDLSRYTEERRVCVVESARLPDTAQYTTLSHRWGGLKIVSLIQENEATLQKSGISAHDLEKTFCDAVEVSLALGTHYLWIGSLCILQDSQQDWHSESRNMAQVYNNAVCNLAATASRNANEGLFRDRPPMLGKPCEISLDVETQSGVSRANYIAYDPQMWIRDVLEGPLNKRAWVLQKRLLSRRQLHFGARQVYWECQTLRASESSPTGLPSNANGRRTLSKQVYSEKVDKLRRLQAVRPRRTQYDDIRQYWEAERSWLAGFNEQLSDLFSLWPRIVEFYTRCNIRDWSKDRLISSSGIAFSLYTQMPAEDKGYFSGVFKHDLPEGLLWASAGPATRPRNADVPSWSWGSLHTFILYPFVTGNIFPFSGRIVLKDRARTVEAVAMKSAGFYAAPRDFRVRIYGGLIEVDVKRFTYKSKDQSFWMTINGEGQYGNSWLDEDERGRKKQPFSAIYWLPCVIASGSNGWYYTSGLLLGRAQGTQNAYTCRRVGLSIVLKAGQQYGEDGGALHQAIAETPEGWVTLV